MSDYRYEQPDRGARAADSDREATVERLRAAHLEGRLADDELQERLEQALSARTYGQLDTVLADLPAKQARRGAPARNRDRTRIAAVPLIALLVIGGVLAGAVAGGHHVAWLVIPVFFLIVRPMLWRARSHA